MAASLCSVNPDFPFTFYDSNNDVVNGTLSDGVCIFPEANCDPSVATAACCGLSPGKGGTGGTYMMIALTFTMFPVFWAIRAFDKTMTPEQRANNEADAQSREPRFITESHCLPARLKKLLLRIVKCGNLIFITVQVLLPIYSRQTQQQYMSVIDRTSLSSSEAFMVPYYKIFSFVSEIMMVKVSYAIAQNDRSLTDRLVHAGIAGVIVAGLLAGITGTIIGAVPAILKVLTFPGLKNDEEKYPGCSFIEKADDSRIIPYWMMESWALMANQLGGVLGGFMLGSFEFNILGWLNLIAAALYAAIWFGNIKTYPNPITLLGLAEFVQDWSTPILSFLFLSSPWGAQIRERTGLELSVKKVFSYFLHPLAACSKKEEEEEDNDATPEVDQKETKELLKEGLKIMFMDVIIQVCMSCSIYLALTTDSAIAYQITAMEAELPGFGPAYATGMAFCTMFLGPFFIAHGLEHLFAKYIGYLMLCVGLLIILIISTTIPFRTSQALSSGTNACAYASNAQCVPFFSEVFGPNAEGGSYTLPFTYYVFPIAASIDAAIMVMRATLLTCLDFDFMLYASIAAALAYIPAVIVAMVATTDFQKQAIALFLAFYVPQLVLVICFGVRLVVIVRKMKNREDGHWSQKKNHRVSVMVAFQNDDDEDEDSC